MAGVHCEECSAALLDITSGNYVIPFGLFNFGYDVPHMAHGSPPRTVHDTIRAISYNRAWVRRRGGHGVIDIETGREIIPIGRYEIRISGNMAIVAFNDRMTYFRSVERLAEGIIDIESGEYLIAFGEYLIRDAYNGMAVMQNSYREPAVIDIESREYIVNYGEFDWVEWDDMRGVMPVEMAVGVLSDEIVILLDKYDAIRRTNCNQTFVVTHAGQSGIIYIN